MFIFIIATQLAISLVAIPLVGLIVFAALAF